MKAVSYVGATGLTATALAQRFYTTLITDLATDLTLVYDAWTPDETITISPGGQVSDVLLGFVNPYLSISKE